MSHRNTVPLALLAAVLGTGSACTIGYGSKNGQLFFEEDDTIGWPSGFQNGGPILVGTRLCPNEVTCNGSPDCPSDVKTADVQACWDPAVSGAGSGDGWCVDVEAAGPVTWSFTPKDCALAPYPAQADEVTFTGIEAADVDADLIQWPEVLAQQFLVDGDGQPLALDWRNPAGADVHVYADSPARLPIGLVDGAGAFVGYNQASVDIDGSGDGQTVNDDTHAEVRLGAGESMDVTLKVADHAFDPVHVVGVAEADLASLEIVDAYFLPEDGASQPVLLRAVLRDRDGHLVYGAPVTWKMVEGTLAFQEPGAPVIGPDYQQVADACVPPTTEGEDRTATVEARLGGLTDTITLAWHAAGTDDTAFTADPTCLAVGDETGGPVGGDDETCGCTSVHGGTFAMLLAGLVIAAQKVRPRKTQPT
jgi:hypothetical protein